MPSRRSVGLSACRAGLGLLLPVALLLAGCTDEPPRAAASPRPSSPTPAPQVAPLPLEASADTPAGAAATVTYFYEELGRALVAQDTTGLRAVSSPACTPCRNFADAIDRDRDAGRRFRGGETGVQVVAATRAAPDRALVVLLYDAAPLQRVDVPATPDAAIDDLRLTVELVRADGGWLVDRISRQAS